MLSAVFTTLQRPTCFSSRAKYTLTDWTVPVYRDWLESDCGPFRVRHVERARWPWK